LSLPKQLPVGVNACDAHVKHMPPTSTSLIWSSSHFLYTKVIPTSCWLYRAYMKIWQTTLRQQLLS